MVNIYVYIVSIVGIVIDYIQYLHKDNSVYFHDYCSYYSYIYWYCSNFGWFKNSEISARQSSLTQT